MSVDVNAWRNVLEEIVGGIADENLQRRSWFGIGPEESSPAEDICQLLGDAAVEEFLNRDDVGLNGSQIEAGKHLVKLMRDLLARTPDRISPSALIDDPGWRDIRKAAARFHELLQRGSAPI